MNIVAFEFFLGTDPISGSFKIILEQNYPNPFNPTTEIEFVISEAGQTTLKVFDVLGNEVSTLVNEQKAVGKYKVTFDASDLPSGVYFYTLQAGNYLNTKKMILLK
ncbi:MAG: T9SS type A sorting domain-containing protein [Ignavibacteriaceae bacterium]|nr:T9SS type A sorting domain-containing protein [Ignavibacteriaceae bacterium]